MTLIGIVVDADTYQPHLEWREHATAPEEKGGSITLMWESEPDVFASRTIQVSRARALQACDALKHPGDVR